MDSFVDRLTAIYGIRVSSRTVSRCNDMVQDCFLRVGRKKDKRRGPRGQIQSEVPTPIFFQKWDYSNDRTFGPIYQGLKDGEKYEQYFLTDLRLVYQDEKGYKYCVPHDIAEQVITAYHNQCHPGVPKLMSLLGRRYIFSMKAKELHSLLEYLPSLPGMPSSQAEKGTSSRDYGFLPYSSGDFQFFVHGLCRHRTCKGH